MISSYGAPLLMRARSAMFTTHLLGRPAKAIRHVVMGCDVRELPLR